jgi:WD40 repeat protein
MFEHLTCSRLLLFSLIFLRRIRVWDLHSGRELLTLLGHQRAVRAVCFAPAPGSDLLVSSSDDRTVRVWSLTARACRSVLAEHLGRVRALGVTATHVVSGSDDHAVKIWDLATGQCAATLLGHRHRVCGLAATEHGIVSASHDAAFKVWDFAGQPTVGEVVAALRSRQRHSVAAITKPVQAPADRIG